VESIEEGDYVLVNPHLLELVDVQGTSHKLVQRTIGPFEVMERINPVVYRLRLPDNYPMHPVFDLEHLCKCHMSKEELGKWTKLPDTREYLKASEEYVVEAILRHVGALPPENVSGPVGRIPTGRRYLGLRERSEERAGAKARVSPTS
jgi:hypothetical protein